MSYWRKTEFWQKIRESFSFFGTLGTGGMAGADAINIADIAPKYMALTAGIALFGALLTHFTKTWFEDKNGDGYVDIFEKKKKP